MLKTFKRILSCVIVVLLLIFALAKTTDVMQRKSSDIKYIPFFEHARDYDVLFMGSSLVMNDIFPMELWHDYGITSYNFGTHSSQMATTYWVMRNALDYSEPKVVVIDCFTLQFQQKTSDNFSFVHLAMDTFPLSMTKIRAVNDLLEDPEIERRLNEGIITENEKRTKIGLLWDYSVYHSRWDEINKDDFVVSGSKEYGAESRIRICEPGAVIENPGTTLSEETVGMTYLKKIIEECRKRDIQVVLTYLPHTIADENMWKEVNTTCEIAKEYGVDYINFPDENIVDFSTDCFDAGAHLNPSGAFKVTDYLGKYLQDKYQLADYRNDTHYGYWNDDYKAYKEMKDSRLNDINDLNTYLMLLEDDDYGFIMSVGDPSVFEDPATLNLLKNKGVKTDEISEESKYIIVCGKESLVVNSDMNESGEYGGYQVIFNEDGQFGVYKGTEELLLLDQSALRNKKRVVSVNVFPMENRRNIINTAKFALPKAPVIGKRHPDKNGIVVLKSKAVRTSK